MRTRPQPITDRFTAYSKADQDADTLLSEYARRDNYENHGGVHVHELPPCLQRIIYHYAARLRDDAEECGDTFQERVEFAAREVLP